MKITQESRTHTPNIHTHRRDTVNHYQSYTHDRAIGTKVTIKDEKRGLDESSSSLSFLLFLSLYPRRPQYSLSLPRSPSTATPIVYCSHIPTDFRARQH
jgi:hypothetical protein